MTAPRVILVLFVATLVLAAPHLGWFNLGCNYGYWGRHNRVLGELQEWRVGTIGEVTLNRSVKRGLESRFQIQAADGVELIISGGDAASLSSADCCAVVVFGTEGRILKMDNIDLKPKRGVAVRDLLQQIDTHAVGLVRGDYPHVLPEGRPLPGSCFCLEVYLPAATTRPAASSRAK